MIKSLKMNKKWAFLRYFFKHPKNVTSQFYLWFKQQETCAMFAVCRWRLRAEYRELDLFVSLKLQFRHEIKNIFQTQTNGVSLGAAGEKSSDLFSLEQKNWTRYIQIRSRDACLIGLMVPRHLTSHRKTRFISDLLS